MDQSLLLALDEQINVRREEFNALAETTKGMTKELTAATDSYTNDQLISMIEKLKVENKDLDERVNAFKYGGIELVSEEML